MWGTNEADDDERIDPNEENTVPESPLQLDLAETPAMENREGQNSKEKPEQKLPTNTPSNKAFGGKIFDEDKFE